MMETYIISYDLNSDKSSDYTKLIDFIKSFGTWAHITESTWAIKTNKTAKEIRDEIADIMPEGSRLFVVKSGLSSAWRNVICSNDWLKKYL